ncbi:hypothetical protein [uncultured Oscillibacter sp.]|uniref:hypothetical protein n=1 Tax=uncultured Oscillibacter sp. TaxID=876091 RepID=UPI0025E37950|nr:hypothetical protein [uncultured Oscillibacter sp.]MCX4372484.1 hypothetical protein [Dysosmobacter sp.]
MEKVTNEKVSPLSGRLWKWLAGLAVLCLAAFLAVWYMPHSEEVSWSGTAVEYRADDVDYAADHEAVIRGTYTCNRAGKRTFVGNFWIGGLDMDPGTWVRLTSEPGGDQFYGASGQPITAPVCGVIQSPGGQGAVALLWDEYTAEPGSIHAVLEEGRRFICIGTLSRKDAIVLADTLKLQITGI